MQTVYVVLRAYTSDVRENLTGHIWHVCRVYASEKSAQEYVIERTSAEISANPTNPKYTYTFESRYLKD